MIKGVILAELGYGFTVSYLDSVPDVAFLTQENDIEIIYNEQKLDEMSFSLDTEIHENYDFISLAIRDLLKGLGISSSYRYNPITGGLEKPSQLATPFESHIGGLLGAANDPITRLANATKGELVMPVSYNKSLKLYAPTTWVNGVSLNYFIPQDDCSVSNILSYNFCKGMVARFLSDDYSYWIFNDLLGWYPSYTISTSTPQLSQGGSTSLLMPYNGSISFSENDTYGIKHEYNPYRYQLKSTQLISDLGNTELYQYIDSFNPFMPGDYSSRNEGISVSILKKDGKWDLVYYLPFYSPLITLQMSDLTFNCSDDEYARTVDGYLRGRISTKKQMNNRSVCTSKFL